MDTLPMKYNLVIPKYRIKLKKNQGDDDEVMMLK